HPLGDEWHVVVEGAACTFLALPRLTRVLASIPSGRKVTITVSVNYMDHAAHQAITDWQRQYEATGGHVPIHGVVQIGHIGRRTHQEEVEPERPEAAA